MKNLMITLLSLAVFSCNKGEENLLAETLPENTPEITEIHIPKTTIKQLITAVETNNDAFNNKTVKLEGFFNFFIPIFQCEALCDGEGDTTGLTESSEFLYKDFYACTHKDEIVLVDTSDNKIAIKNFPKFTINPDSFSKNQLQFASTPMEFTVKVVYSETYNFCKRTKHPSIVLEMEEETINQLALKVPGITLVNN